MRITGIATLSTVLLLTACGSSYEDTSPDDIAQDVADAMEDVTSLHIGGTVTTEGQTIDLDLSLAENGNCEGSMSVEGQGSFELIVTDDGQQGFIKPDEEFWRSQGGPQAGTIIERVGDKWVAATGDMASAAEACDWEQLASGFADPEEIEIEDVTGTGDVDGEETVTVEFTSDDGNEGVAHIRSDEPHYLVKFDVDQEGDVTLSEFDEPVEPEAPEDVFDFAELG